LRDFNSKHASGNVRQTNHPFFLKPIVANAVFIKGKPVLEVLGEYFNSSADNVREWRQEDFKKGSALLRGAKNFALIYF
jgi:hypothetical protein